MYDTWCMTKLSKLARRLLLPPCTALCPCVWHTRTYHLLVPCSLIHLPAPLECRVTAMRQPPTNGLRWERLGSVVGTLLPSLLSTWESVLPQGGALPATRCLNERHTKPLTNRWVTRVTVGFSLVYSLFSSPYIFFFIHDWRAALYFGRTEKNERTLKEKQNSQSVGTFPCSFFLLAGLLSALTLLTQVFVHLWHWISGSASSLCAKISIVSYFLFQVSNWKHI